MYYINFLFSCDGQKHGIETQRNAIIGNVLMDLIKSIPEYYGKIKYQYCLYDGKIIDINKSFINEYIRDEDEITVICDFIGTSKINTYNNPPISSAHFTQPQNIPYISNAPQYIGGINIIQQNTIGAQMPYFNQPILGAINYTPQYIPDDLANSLHYPPLPVYPPIGYLNYTPLNIQYPQHNYVNTYPTNTAQFGPVINQRISIHTNNLGNYDNYPSNNKPLESKVQSIDSVSTNQSSEWSNNEQSMKSDDYSYSKKDSGNEFIDAVSERFKKGMQSYYSCPEGHPLEWTGNELLYRDDLRCYICFRSNIPAHPIRWKCAKCTTFFCSLCYKNLVLDICPYGHSFKPKIIPFTCDKCYEEFDEFDMCYMDIECNLTYCLQCFKKKGL